MQTIKFRSITLAAAMAACSLAFVGCTTTKSDNDSSGTSSRASIDAQVSAAMSKLYNTVPSSREMVSKAAGVLVFPQVIGASLGVGAEYGKGSLMTGGKTVGYYSTTQGSLGFQAGAQSKAVIYLFNTQDALAKFQNSKGWTAGADATVAVAKVGANGAIDSQSASQPVVSFVLTNVGLEAGVSVSGAKISKIDM